MREFLRRQGNVPGRACGDRPPLFPSLRKHRGQQSGLSRTWILPRLGAPLQVGQRCSPARAKFPPMGAAQAFHSFSINDTFVCSPWGQGWIVRFCVLDGSSPSSMDPCTCSVSLDGPVPRTAQKPRKPKSMPLQPKWTGCFLILRVCACVCVCV